VLKKNKRKNVTYINELNAIYLISEKEGKVSYTYIYIYIYIYIYVCDLGLYIFLYKKKFKKCILGTKLSSGFKFLICVYRKTAIKCNI